MHSAQPVPNLLARCLARDKTTDMQMQAAKWFVFVFTSFQMFASFVTNFLTIRRRQYLAVYETGTFSEMLEGANVCLIVLLMNVGYMCPLT